jgi:Cu/Ag efflux pump CusA
VGSFFAPLALSYILAIMASLAVALTVTPALSLLFFSKGIKHTEDPLLQRWVKSGYGKILGFVSRWPRALLAVGVVICVGAIFLVPAPGDEYLPEFREGHFVLQVQAVPGTSLPEMMRIGGEITKLVMAKEEVATVELQVGRAELGEDTWEPNRCEFHVELKPNIPGREQAKLMDDMRDLLDGFPGIQAEVVTFLGDRISETITGESAPVVVNVYGDDLDVIDDKAQEIVSVLQAVPGGKNAQVTSPPGAPRMAVRLRSDRLTQFGFRSVEVLEAVQASCQGTVVGQVHEGSQGTDVNVILDRLSGANPSKSAIFCSKTPPGRLCRCGNWLMFI